MKHVKIFEALSKLRLNEYKLYYAELMYLLFVVSLLDILSLCNNFNPIGSGRRGCIIRFSGSTPGIRSSSRKSGVCTFPIGVYFLSACIIDFLELRYACHMPRHVPPSVLKFALSL